MKPEAFDEASDFTGAIVYCPVCATPQDAEKWGLQTFDCGTCESQWSMDLERDKVATHSLFG